MTIFRTLYIALFALLLFPVGWLAGLFMARLTGNNELGYSFGFVLGVLFLALPFIVNWLRSKKSRGASNA